ncbi:hypothetical protein DCAR_0934661 [Daucus carota subsp. sativus]|uniref:Ubiquitin-like protease family profile domain-containing protein n=1 Tax=Daucus carota subsp. sativus TaxID=79200 RepID=A0AAF1BCY3_DAUCS|nr:hypothetical protein DCAR_0934661 [Daucus carota subsp. sativus]
MKFGQVSNEFNIYLIETKLLFDTELKLALEKEPTNIGLLDIQQLINDVFFPICAFEHFYLIFYNIKNAAYEIIDNIDREIDAQICYGDKPRILHYHFTDYLESKGLINISRRLRRLTPTFTKMTWQTTRNSIDCGIFLMRHMESYMGDARTWTTDLNEEQVKLSSNFFLIFPTNL